MIMKKYWNMDYLGVAVDMAGCPNRCRHCWLGAHRNGNISPNEFCSIAEQFKNWTDENNNNISELEFFSWWREPDYRNDYRYLWDLEQKLSSPGRSQRFELLSIWRLARDESYAQWATTLGPKACQISFFGMEKNTDWGAGRKGAFRDSLLATERLLSVGIAPRWQLFITKRCLNELQEFTKLMSDLKLVERCHAIGHKFDFFIGGIAPEGNGYALECERIEFDDLAYIPNKMAALSRDGFTMLGKAECDLYDELITMHSSPHIDSNVNVLSITADYDVYPNIAEPTEWWRLGNLKRDGLDPILKAYRDETTPGMRANRTIPISQLAQQYGNKKSKKLYHKSDLIIRFLHQWGLDYMVGKHDAL